MGFFNRLKGPKQLQLRHGEHALRQAAGGQAGDRASASRPSIVMGLALVIGVDMFLRFFFANGSTGEDGKLKEVVSSQKAAIPAIAHAPGAQPTTVVTKTVDAPKPKEKLPAGVQYILDMAANARARHAGWYGHRDIVEFRASGGGQVLDRFITEQLWALGWSVRRTNLVCC